MEIKNFNDQLEILFNKIHELNSVYDTSGNNVIPPVQQVSGKIFNWFVIGPLGVGFAFLLLLLWIGKIPSVSFAALILILIGYIGITTFQLALIIENRRNIILFLKNPLTMILTRVKDETALDFTKLSSLNDVKSEVICLANRHLITERESFERRIGVLVGALEKIGLIPGFATLYLAWLKLTEQNTSISIDPWMAGAVFGLYFFAVYFHFLFTRLDRYIATLDEIIKMRKSQQVEK